MSTQVQSLRSQASGDGQSAIPAQPSAAQAPSREKPNISHGLSLHFILPQLPDESADSKHTSAVEQVLFELRKHEQVNPRAERRSAGFLSLAGQYMFALLPKLTSQGPPDSSQSGRESEVPQILHDSLPVLRHAAQQNNSDAMWLLGEMNFYGNFSHAQNYGEAFKWFERLATYNGNSSAQHIVGFMYATGIGGAVQQDQARALLYHTFAAKGGNTKSEMTLAYRYHQGIGTARNCEAGVKHYKKVAEKSIEWYRSGPPGGMAWVQDSYRLADEEGGVYGEGASFSSAGHNANKGGPNSDAHAALDDVLEYLDLMSRKGDFKATFSLGRIHYDGQKGLARNMKQAKWYFMKVAKLYWRRDGQIIETDKHGLERMATKAAGYLGRMFLRGDGVDQSFEKAHTWFQRGIGGGDAGSQYGLGLMHLEGLGLPKNIIKAREYFKASADQDYAPSQVAIGMLFLDQGSTSDIQIANRYFELAARYQHIEALYFLAELIDQGLGREKNCALATAYYKTVAEKAEPLLSSFEEANRAYDNKDLELALVEYMMAAEQGYEKGQANVAYMMDQEKSSWKLPQWLDFSASKPSILQNDPLALIYWTRSAMQLNVDSTVKMGDYYLSGIGTEQDTEKAATCYGSASEFQQSAQALYNLGWMHENGIGLTQDFHLAARYYEDALETNEEAYLPITISLFRLRLRSWWNTVTDGSIPSIMEEPSMSLPDESSEA